jgi:hypothetical protein
MASRGHKLPSRVCLARDQSISKGGTCMLVDLGIMVVTVLLFAVAGALGFGYDELMGTKK